MRYLALGMIETRGLVGCIEAADQAVKAADVHLIKIEKVTGGLTMIHFIGDVGAVRAAVDAAAGAAARVGELVSTHLIPRLDLQTVRMLGLDSPPSPQEALAASVLPAEASEDSPADQYRGMSTPELRALARSLEGFPVKGRELQRLSKEQLIELLVQHEGKGHA